MRNFFKKSLVILVSLTLIAETNCLFKKNAEAIVIIKEEIIEEKPKPKVVIIKTVEKPVRPISFQPVKVEPPQVQVQAQNVEMSTAGMIFSGVIVLGILAAAVFFAVNGDVENKEPKPKKRKTTIIYT